MADELMREKKMCDLINAGSVDDPLTKPDSAVNIYVTAV